ncbi:MAG: EAL and HDOD domain-containing protein, partial [Ramlibacter sp.]
MSALPLPASATPAPAATDAVVARQAILDARNAIFGYALSDRSGAAPGVQRDAALLVHALSLSATPSIAGRRLLFVRCSWPTMASGQLDLVDPERVVIDLELPAGLDAAAVQAGAQTLAALRARGFRFAFAHDVLASSWRSWLAQAAFLKLDIARLPAATLGAIVKAIRPLPLRVIACGIESHEAHQQAASHGLELLQGGWFAKPVLMDNRSLRPNQAVILQLIAMLRREADTAEIETLLKRDASLSLNLLRFLNSGAFGLATEVSSFRGAVMLLGMQRLLRWATLLMATSREGASALGQTAVVRGRLMELLAAELLTPEQCDQAFVVGVFSLLETMTGVPLARTLEGIGLPEPVAEALLHRRGLFEPFLALTEACEGNDDEAFARNADQLLLSGHQVNMAHLQA